MSISRTRILCRHNFYNFRTFATVKGKVGGPYLYYKSLKWMPGNHMANMICHSPQSGMWYNCLHCSFRKLKTVWNNVVSNQMLFICNILAFCLSGLSFHFRKNMKRIISELYVRDNCHPFKASLLIWVQLPLWVFISIALRNLSLAASDSSAGTWLLQHIRCTTRAMSSKAS